MCDKACELRGQRLGLGHIERSILPFAAILGRGLHAHVPMLIEDNASTVNREQFVLAKDNAMKAHEWMRV
jgi:hypothetical protein